MPRREKEKVPGDMKFQEFVCKPPIDREEGEGAFLVA